MKIANASNLFLYPRELQSTSEALAKGESVKVQTSEPAAAAPLPRPSMELLRQIEAGRATVSAVHAEPDVWKQLNVPGMVVGGAGGTIAGAAIGVMLNTLRSVHPTSAATFDACCAVLGGVAGSMVGSRQFVLKASVEKEGLSFALSAAEPK